jgi:pimeloyl-ACP methyl ester carboxylesterase
LIFPNGSDRLPQPPVHGPPWQTQGSHGRGTKRKLLLKIIGPLTNPTAQGASASDAFDMIIPSMPGYGYSGKQRDTGWGSDRIARAWTELMKRLGYPRYVAQGGDWGAIITDVTAVQAPPELVGMHTNMAGVVPAEASTALAQNVLGAGGPPPSGLSAGELRAAFRSLASGR